jgi:oligopeptide transport system substrate-binding protein
MFANLAVDIAYATSIRGFDIGKRRSISRRHVLVPPLVLAGCATVSPYFGRTRVPGSQRLVHPNGEEPSSLDPAQSVGGNGDVIIAALLESLTALGPLTLEPAAALATHYNVDAHAIQYTFFLRGHPRPRGIRLRNTDSLNFEISGSRKAPSDRVPAFWSDGTPITAHDFVYSWRRLVDPAMAAPLAFYLEPLGNYKEIVKGARKPETLAVRALDDFTFQLELIVPISPFLKVLWQPLLAAVPRQSIEVARQSGSGVSWTAPGNYISSGPFLVARMEGQRPSRPHEESDVLGSSFGRDGGDRFPADLEWNN